LAGYLELMGFRELAKKIQQESIAAPEAAFNKLKTWTEYINRLMGAILGALILAMTAYSTKFRKDQPILFYSSFAALLLVIFQGWIGSLVVSTNLLPGMVTFHMALAILLIALLIYVFFISSQGVHKKSYHLEKSGTVKTILILSIALFFLQIGIGTQVREAVDLAAITLGQTGRDQWINHLGDAYYFHRTFSLFLTAITGYLFVLLRRTDNNELRLLTNLLLGLVVMEVIFGITMAYFSIPAWVQPLHLLIAVLILGLQFWLFLKTEKFRTT
jgi:cytochrome c oxidase assembly protein subunit 15